MLLQTPVGLYVEAAVAVKTLCFRARSDRAPSRSGDQLAHLVGVVHTLSAFTSGGGHFLAHIDAKSGERGKEPASRP